MIDQYIVDFYCSKAKLIIELDGSQHYTVEGEEYDSVRTEVLEQYGLEVIRFSNDEIDRHFDDSCRYIEEKIKESVYTKEISARDYYNDICDQIEDKENGTYLLLSKFEEDVIFEYHITIQDDGFNLGLLTIRTPEGIYQTDFDS